MFKYFLLLLIFCYFLISEACSCTPSSPDRSLRIYCTAPWVAEVTVDDVKVDGVSFFEFSINYTKVYKMPSKFNETYPTKIYSHQQSSACGRKLSKDKDYLLVGYEKTLHAPAGMIGINQCSYLDKEFEEKLRSNATAIDCSKFEKESMQLDNA